MPDYFGLANLTSASLAFQERWVPLIDGGSIYISFKSLEDLGKATRMLWARGPFILSRDQVPRNGMRFVPYWDR